MLKQHFKLMLIKHFKLLVWLNFVKQIWHTFLSTQLKLILQLQQFFFVNKLDQNSRTNTKKVLDQHRLKYVEQTLSRFKLALLICQSNNLFQG